MIVVVFFFFQAEDGIRDLVRSRGLGDVYKRQVLRHPPPGRPDDRRRTGLAEDGARRAAGLRPDAQPQVGHLHGCVRQLGRDVQQLRDRPGLSLIHISEPTRPY